MRTINVTARYEITFQKKMTDKQIAELESGAADIEDMIDESEPYRLLSSEGTCEMDWDFATLAKKPRKR
jgi:hypothetical protein